jgi:hypothetical protein
VPVVAACIVVAVLGVAVLGAFGVYRTISVPSLAGRASQVAFDDDFGSDRGWDFSTWEGDRTLHHSLTPGDPGSLRLTADARSNAAHVLYPGSSYQRVKIVAAMSRMGGANGFGVSCVPPEFVDQGFHSYQFWAGGDGSASIDLDDGKGNNRTLRSTRVAGWTTGVEHRVTAVCASDGRRTGLELWVDARRLLTASDDTFRGPFIPAILVAADSDVSVRRFTVSSLA